jgi:hypothetical protein
MLDRRKFFGTVAALLGVRPKIVPQLPAPERAVWRTITLRVRSLGCLVPFTPELLADNGPTDCYIADLVAKEMELPDFKESKDG